MENNEWKKLNSKDGYEYYILEKDKSKDKPIISLSSIRTETRNIDSSRKIKILQIDIPSKFLEILATKDGELVGFLESSILEDGATATMIMQTQLAKMDLPEGVNDSKLNIHRHNGAIFVDEEHRKRGIAKKMMNELFRALKERNVKTLKISDIKEGAVELYRSTGAVFDDKRGATYNIEEMAINEPKNEPEI